ncbi:MAG TPA: M20 family metallo-hydrolase [Acidimicrobiales bacterium]|nr:M20 family metallo-hydrolase [Acidimicrobiales bacterium]
MVAPLVDGRRLLDRIEKLASIGGAIGAGITRLAWSADDRRARSLVERWATDARAVTHIDPAGNLIAERAGAVAGAAPVVAGSHLDTVIGAGHLDGAYGVVAGIEVLACLEEQGLVLEHPLRVVAFSNEEGVVAPPFTGSRAISGGFADSELSIRGPDGQTLAGRLLDAGLDPDAVLLARWAGPVAATVELHIEQGPVLDRAGVGIGAVTGITGQRRGGVRVTGQANHAGTTPMAARRDALAAAARTVISIQALATEGPADVATVGRLAVQPGVANVVPGEVVLSFDIRSIDETSGDSATEMLQKHLVEIAEATGTTIDLDISPPTRAVLTDPQLRSLVVGSAYRRGLGCIEIASGAGHDAAHLARLGPMAMIFVPSIDGVSHNPAEATAPQALIDGAQVLLDVIVGADKTVGEPMSAPSLSWGEA